MGGVGRPGEVTITRRSRLVDVTGATTADSSGGVLLAPEKLNWLDSLSKSFDRYRWDSVVLEYVPGVGTTTSGFVAYGMDWGLPVSSTLKPDRDQVLACTPVVDNPVWQRSKFWLPKDQLQSRKWYSLDIDITKDPLDACPGSILWHTTSRTAGTLGEIWIEYRVTLQGTRKG